MLSQLPGLIYAPTSAPANLTGLLSTSPLSTYLTDIDGCVAFEGALHIRGIDSHSPLWHSLPYWWQGAHALFRSYPTIRSIDIPFAQDCVGNQLILREQDVYVLYTEENYLEALGLDLHDFLVACRYQPDKLDFLQNSIAIVQQVSSWELGKLINVYPPFCTKESSRGVSLKAIDAIERLQWLKAFSAVID